MKKLPTNLDVINTYLEQSLPSATNPRKSLWFKGTSLYSYDSLLAIIEPLDEVLFLDANIRNYSNTTQKQVHLLLKECNVSKIYSIPLGVSHNEVLQYYWDCIEQRITSFNRAIKQTSKDSHKHWILTILNEVQSYMNYVGVDKRTKEYKHKHQITKQLFKYQLL